MNQSVVQRILPRTHADSAVWIFDVVDPTAAGEGFDAFDQEVIQLNTGRFRGRQIMIRLFSCQVVFQSARMRLRSRTTVHDQLVAFVVLAPSATARLFNSPRNARWPHDGIVSTSPTCARPPA